MKNFLFIFFFASSVLQAQYKIIGSLSPSENYNTAILYKIVGAKQEYLQNTKINNGGFYFNLGENEKTGVYRVNYDTKNNGFVDFIFNKENVTFSFNPQAPENTKTFSQSKENILYTKFLNAITYVQYDVDSLQVAYLKNPSLLTTNRYQKAVENINKVQQSYIEQSAGMLAYHFIKATDRYNSASVCKTPNEYLSGLKLHFFDSIDFKNTVLYNSPFLVDRIADYIFYMNYAEDVATQLALHKEASSYVIHKIEDPVFKRDVIHFLIDQFKQLDNPVLVDYLIESHFDNLPKSLQNTAFKEAALSAMKTAIGRTAPDFSWQENGNTLKLSALNDGKNYILVFYSTTCPHCTKELPELYAFLKDKPTTKVVAFALEENDFFYKKFTANLKGWHHVLGLNKWENKIARTYQIIATPTYFVLNSDKKIMAKPEQLNELKKLFE